MEASNDIMIRISPNEGKITVEEDAQGVFSRKSITEEDLLRCFKDSLRTADEGYHSGFLPLNTISLYQSETVKRFVLWHPRLYADVSVYDTPYPHFPIPRLVFGFSLNQEGKASHCRIGVVADEIPTPETPMYYYPFSNVSRESGSLCVGANTLPIYKKPHKAHNLPAFLLSIPNNMHYYSSSNNKLGLEYRELMEHLKDKTPNTTIRTFSSPKRKRSASLFNGPKGANIMWNKSAEELRAALSAPFQSADIEWRISATNSAKTSGLAVPYVTNRAIQTRLDSTVGIDGWHNDLCRGKARAPAVRHFHLFSVPGGVDHQMGRGR